MFGTYWFWFEEKWGINNGDLLYFYNTIVQQFFVSRAFAVFRKTKTSISLFFC